MITAQIMNLLLKTVADLLEPYTVEKGMNGRGHAVVDANGYRYSNPEKARYGYTRYRCSDRSSGCKATVFVSGDYIVRRGNYHIPKAHSYFRRY